jgi:MFS family permease
MSSSTGGPRPRASALRSPDFRFYLAGRFLATVAVQMVGTAVAFQIYALTHSTFELALVGLAQFLPLVVLSLFAGHVADRHDRRLVLLGSDVLFGLCALGLWALSRGAGVEPRAILGVLVVLGIARAFYGPSGSALLPALVSREQLSNAVALQSTSWQLASISGPFLGGTLYGLTGGAASVYWIAALGFVLAGLLLLGIQARPSSSVVPARAKGQLLAGLRYVLQHRILFGAIALDFFAVFLGGATALLPVFATDILHVGASGLGALRAAPSLGAACTAAFLAFRPLGGRAGVKLLVCVGIFGAATIGFGLSRSFGTSLLCLMVLGAADMVSAVVRGTLVQAATPDAMRGRVSAVNLIFIGASNELGEFESGTVASLVGAVPCVVLGGTGTLIVVALWAWLFPQIRGVNRLEDITPTPESEPKPEGDGQPA